MRAAKDAGRDAAGHRVADRKTFFVGLNTGFIQNGEPDNRCIDFYSRRSGSPLYATIVGNVVIPGGYGTNAGTPQISDSRAWSDLASAIANAGALPAIQLSTTWEHYQGVRKFLPDSADDQLEAYKAIVGSISSEELVSTFNALRQGTELAIDAGYRHVQLHAAHGYFFNLVLDDRLNARFDQARALLADWLEVVNTKGIESSIRISAYSGHNELDKSDPIELFSYLYNMKFSYIDISMGFYNINKQYIYPSRPNIVRRRLDIGLKISEAFPTTQFILSGRMLDQNLEGASGNVHVGICRDLIANPNILRERSGGCRNSGKCHYYSRGESHITCGQWVSDK